MLATDSVNASTSAGRKSAATAIRPLSPNRLLAMPAASMTTPRIAPNFSTSESRKGFLWTRPSGFSSPSLRPSRPISSQAATAWNSAAASSGTASAMASGRLMTPASTSTRATITPPAARMLPASRPSRAALSLARRASVSVTTVEETRPPSAAASTSPRDGPTSFTAT